MFKSKNDMSFHKLERSLREKIISKADQNILNELKQLEVVANKDREKLRKIRRENFNYEKALNNGGLSPFQIQRYRQLLKEQKEKNNG
jgi:hypothetical protein